MGVPEMKVKIFSLPAFGQSYSSPESADAGRAHTLDNLQREINQFLESFLVSGNRFHSVHEIKSAVLLFYREPE